MVKIDEVEIDRRLDEIQEECERISAETRNTLNACREGHPLGRGRHRADLFNDAAFVLSRRPFVSSRHAAWLNKVARQCRGERATAA